MVAGYPALRYTNVQSPKTTLLHDCIPPTQTAFMPQECHRSVWSRFGDTRAPATHGLSSRVAYTTSPRTSTVTPAAKRCCSSTPATDATIAFKEEHTTSALSQLPQHSYKGRLDLRTKNGHIQDDEVHKRLLSDSHTKVLEAQQRQSGKVASARRRLPRLKDLTNLDDMEIAALIVLPPLASAFYACGSDTEASLQANRLAFSRYYFNPRVLRRVDTVDTSVTLFGKPYPLPIMGLAVGNTHMAGPDCDWHLTNGLAQCKLPHMVSTFDLQKRAKSENIFADHFLQLYVQRDHATSTKLVRQAVKEGALAVFVTVDVAQIANREKDRKVWVEAHSATNWPENESR